MKFCGQILDLLLKLIRFLSFDYWQNTIYWSKFHVDMLLQMRVQLKLRTENVAAFSMKIVISLKIVISFGSNAMCLTEFHRKFCTYSEFKNAQSLKML